MAATMFSGRRFYRDMDYDVLRAVQALNRAGSTTNTSMVARHTGLSRRVVQESLDSMWRLEVRNVSKGAAYHWRITAQGREALDAALARQRQAEEQLYEAACRTDATAQGLDPVMERLRGAGYDVAVQQAGGFCMVAEVADPDGQRLWVTADGDDTYEVGFYRDDEDDGQLVAASVTVDMLPDLVAEHLPKAKTS